MPTETLKPALDADRTPENLGEYPNSYTVEFTEGRVTYSLYGDPNSAHNPIIVVNDMVQGRKSNKELAALLSADGRQVLIYEDPEYIESISAKDKRNTIKAVDFQAEAVLAAAKDAGLLDTDRSVNMIGHSLGGLIAQRIRQIAQRDRIAALDPEKDSQLALIASSGNIRQESYRGLTGRWLGYMMKGLIEAKALDPKGVKRGTLITNALKQRNKAIGEIRAVKDEELHYNGLGEALHLVYPEDKMFPWRRTRPTVQRHIENGRPIAVATPIDYGQPALKGLELWLTKAHLKGRKARLNFALSYRGAGHDEPTSNPERTAKALIDYFDDGRVLHRARAGHKKHYPQYAKT